MRSCVEGDILSRHALGTSCDWLDSIVKHDKAVVGSTLNLRRTTHLKLRHGVSAVRNAGTTSAGRMRGSAAVLCPLKCRN